MPNKKQYSSDKWHFALCTHFPVRPKCFSVLGGRHADDPSHLKHKWISVPNNIMFPALLKLQADVFGFRIPPVSFFRFIAVLTVRNLVDGDALSQTGTARELYTCKLILVQHIEHELVLFVWHIYQFTTSRYPAPFCCAVHTPCTY